MQTNSERHPQGIFLCQMERRERVEKDTKTAERDSGEKKRKAASVLRQQKIENPKGERTLDPVLLCYRCQTQM